jgi:hypothetical protein
MSVYAPCADCSGEIVVGVFDTITVPRIDEEGFPQFGPDSKMLYINLPLPAHRAHTTWARQVFDPTGLAPSLCTHGLLEHPNGITHPWAVTWIRAKHLDVTKGDVWSWCPVCRGEPRPADLTEPRDA